ncbi:MAG: methionine--tRNA ligase subunit beta [Patescibacteria group bacterium]
MIEYSDFQKIELKVAKIIEAERVDGSEKLIKLKVSLGTEERQIVAGIGKTYLPENLVNKEIIVVANLAPRQLMGLESQGMLLAAHDENGDPVILIPEKETPLGSQIS